MSSSRIDFGPDSRSFRDPVDHSLEVWLPEKATDTQREWLRMKLRKGDKFEEFEDLTVRTVQVQRMMEDLRGWFSKSLASVLQARDSSNGTVHYIPDESGQLTNRKARAISLPEQMQLLTPNGVNHIQEEVVTRMSTVMKHSRVGEAVLVQGSQQQLGELMGSEKIRLRIKRLREELAQFGSIVYERRPEKPERVCVMIKHFHGSRSMFENYKNDRSVLLNFFSHQNEIRKALHRITEICLNDIHLFPEGIGTGFEDSTISMIALSNSSQSIEGSIGLGDHIDYSVLDLIMRKFEAVKVYNIAEATERAFRNTLGDQRFIVETIKSNLWPARLHGLCTMERHKSTLQKDADTVEGMIEAGKVDFRTLHLHISQLLQMYLKENSTGIVVLGGWHFHSGYIIDREWHNKETNNGALCLESVVSADENLANTHLFVLETQSLPRLLEDTANLPI